MKILLTVCALVYIISVAIIWFIAIKELYKVLYSSENITNDMVNWKTLRVSEKIGVLAAWFIIALITSVIPVYNVFAAYYGITDGDNKR